MRGAIGAKQNAIGPPDAIQLPDDPEKGEKS